MCIFISLSVRLKIKEQNKLEVTKDDLCTKVYNWMQQCGYTTTAVKAEPVAEMAAGTTWLHTAQHTLQVGSKRLEAAQLLLMLQSSEGTGSARRKAGVAPNWPDPSPKLENILSTGPFSHTSAVEHIKQVLYRNMRMPTFRFSSKT